MVVSRISTLSFVENLAKSRKKKKKVKKGLGLRGGSNLGLPSDSQVFIPRDHRGSYNKV